MNLKTFEEFILLQDMKSQFIVYDDNIYYINKYDSCLYAVKADGSNIRKVYTQKISFIEDIRIDNGIIYLKRNNSIYKINENKDVNAYDYR